MRSFDKRLVGFSTGALTRGDWRTGIERCRALHLEVIELSALRYEEFNGLVDGAKNAKLSDFSYVSIHLPASYATEDELSVLKGVHRIAEMEWPLILHPDAVKDWAGWKEFGSLICIENMDKRKLTGRTVDELDQVFECLPEASFCFDYGHAKQVDPTMSQGRSLLERFGNRLRQIHFSDVDSNNHHVSLNYPALETFARLRDMTVPIVPIILETAVEQHEAEAQVELARQFFSEHSPFASASDHFLISR